METKRIKVLDENDENSKIVDKMALYDDNGSQIGCYSINVDEYGHEYYCLSNPYNKSGSFTGRPKDAIECIRNGLGDSVQRSKIFGIAMERVVRYLDREYGNKVRAKTLDGWKNAKFAYGVKFLDFDLFSCGSLVTKDKKLMSVNDFPKDILYFDNEEDAKSFINEVNEKAINYCKEYSALFKTKGNDCDYKNIIKPFFNSIEGKVEYGMDSLYWRVFYGLYEGKETGKPEYKMEVVQLIKVE